MRAYSVDIRREVEVCYQPLLTNFRWVDNLVGFNGQPLSGIANYFGVVALLGMAEAPPGDSGAVRGSKKKNIRLIGAISPGFTLEDYNQHGLFLWGLANKFGAKSDEIIELTNSFLLEYPMEALAKLPGDFTSPKGHILTICWPYDRDSIFGEKK